jgi:hypothetical protein
MKEERIAQLRRLRCNRCGLRAPKTPQHVRCWQCLHGTEPPPCKGCGGPSWMSGWCQTCHPQLCSPQSVPRSCRTCLAWGVLDAPNCKACRTFARGHPIGVCLSCDRRVATSGGYCRLCRLQAQYLAGLGHKDRAPYERVARTGQQLFLANTHRALWLQRHPAGEHAELPVQRPNRGGLGLRSRAWPVQDELFALPAHQRPTRVSANDEPRLAWLAYLLSAAERLAETGGWSADLHYQVAQTLEVLVAASQPGVTFRASDVERQRGEGRNITRTLQVLQSLDLLDDDRPDRDDAWLRERTAGLAPTIQAEITAWAKALHSGGSRTKAKSELTWRHYVTDAVDAADTWSAKYDSLREVTRDDIHAVLSAPRPGDGHNLVTALRSLFSFLKRERRVFRDPTTRLPRRLTRRPIGSIPQPLAPSAIDEIAEVRDSPTAWLIVVLAAHHALTANPIRLLRLEHVDLPGRRLRIGDQDRLIDELTFAALRGYLADRQARWPRTTNPYLMVNQQTAHHDGPTSRWWVRKAARLHATTLGALRCDRILEEALSHGIPDALHVAAMFGLHPDTAQRYTEAVWPRYRG